MKKTIVSLLAVIILIAGGCTGPTPGVAVVQKPEQKATVHGAGSGETGEQLTVLYIPMDNRPINYDNVLSLAEIAGVELLTPPLDILGSEGPTGGQDGPGNPTAVRQWLVENAGRADTWIVSLDMLLYGGLAPSRSHDRTRQEVLADMRHLRELLVEKRRDVPVYAFGTIIRSAASSASPKQPGYFKDYGDNILALSKLWDLADRGEATPEQLSQLEQVKKEIPSGVLEDYLQRRETNLAALRQAINFVAGGLVDYLVLGRDDCTPHGFTRVDLRVLEEDIRQRGLAGQVDSYPGADELGAVLLARAVNNAQEQQAGRAPAADGGPARVNNAMERQPKIYVDWATPLGPEITALYEDVTLAENVRLHIKSAGGRMADSPEEADLILAVNSPVDKVTEASMQPGETVPGEHHLALVSRINKWLEQGKAVAVADVAYANGADRAFMEALTGIAAENNSVAPGTNAATHTAGAASRNGVTSNITQSNIAHKDLTSNQTAPVRATSSVLPRLTGYAGCNTAGNSIGMALAHGMIYGAAASVSDPLSAAGTRQSATTGAVKAATEKTAATYKSLYNSARRGRPEDKSLQAMHREYMLTRIIEDWGFQSVVRPAIIKTGYFRAISAGTPLDNTATQRAEQEIIYRLNNFLDSNLTPIFGDETRIDNVTLPWNRLFDISFTLEHVQHIRQ